jgi:glutathione-regulated potassium-efflux system protein KefB
MPARRRRRRDDIDNDPEMIEAATRFGFKVYYGDGSRLDRRRAPARRG